MDDGRHGGGPRSVARDAPEEDEHARGEARFLAYAMPQSELAITKSAPLDLLLRAFVACVLMGGLTSAVIGVWYYFAIADAVEMDWEREGALFFFFGCGIGAATGAGSLIGMLVVRRWLGPSARGLRAGVVTVLGAMLGVAILGTLPGSVGTAYFGAKQAPFMGLASISVVPFTGALVSAAFVARAEVRDGGREVSWIWALVSSVLAIVPVAGAGVLLALSVPDDVALAWMRAVARELAPGRDGVVGGLGMLGAVLGAALGAALGLHMGLTTVTARLRAKNVEPEVSAPFGEA